jgi:putative ABC transport system permease protein
VRITSGTNRRLRLFAVTQIAASFVLLAGAGMLLTTLVALQRTSTGFETRRVLAVNVPVMSYGRTPDQVVAFYQGVMRQIEQLPGGRSRVGWIVGALAGCGRWIVRRSILGRRVRQRGR